MFDDEVQLFAALQSLQVLHLPLLNQCSQTAIDALRSYLPSLQVLQLYEWYDMPYQMPYDTAGC